MLPGGAYGGGVCFWKLKNGLFLDLSVGYLGVLFIMLYIFFSDLFSNCTTLHGFNKRKEKPEILRLARGSGVKKKKEEKPVQLLQCLIKLQIQPKPTGCQIHKV